MLKGLGYFFMVCNLSNLLGIRLLIGFDSTFKEATDSIGRVF